MRLSTKPMKTPPELEDDDEDDNNVIE